jgi:hypothetical protein
MIRRSAVALLAAGVLIGLLGANYVMFSTQGSHTDFYYMAWRPGRALMAGDNPYQAPYSALYPPWTLVLGLPFACLPISFALASWALASECAAIGFVAITLRALNWELRSLQVALLPLLALVFRPSLAAILHGQYVFITLLLVGLTIFGLRTRRDILAGFCLAVTVIKPQLVFLLIPALLAWAFAQRRWKALVAFLLTALGLVALSQALLPSWACDWLSLIYQDQLLSRTFMVPSVWGLAYHVVPACWVPLASVASLTMLAVLAWVLWRCRHTEAYLPFMVSATIIVAQIITPKAWNYDHAMLLLPFLYCLYYVAQREKLGALAARWWLAILVGWLLVLPYLLSLWAMAHHSEVPYALLPITIGILLLSIQLLGQRQATVKEISESDEFVG